MAGMTGVSLLRSQFAAVAWARWRAFVNSLRTTRGRLEVVARILAAPVFLVVGFGGLLGFGAGAYAMVKNHHAEWLPALLWAVLIFWQAVPILSAAFGDGLNAAGLLRFPLSYRSYFLITLAHGSLDPVVFLAGLWLFAIATGIAIADFSLFLWAVPMVAGFGLFSLFLSQAVIAWLDRWLAQRRTREILGLVFFLTMMSLQFIGPAMDRHGHLPAAVVSAARIASGGLHFLPPGAAGSSIAEVARGNWVAGASNACLLGAWGLAALWILNLRLRAMFRGENLSEAAGRAAPVEQGATRRGGWSLGGLSGPVAAAFEKELRYFFRSGPMLFNLMAPVFMLLIFRYTPAPGGGFLARNNSLVFPIGAIYTLMTLANVYYNCLGADGPAAQLYFALPVRMRQVLMGKNLAYAFILALEMALLWCGIAWLYRPPSADLIAATVAGVLFAAPADFAVGNLLSLLFPKKIDLGNFNRQRLPGLAMLIGFAFHPMVGGLGVLVFWATRSYGGTWLATLIFLALSAASWGAYFAVLRWLDRRTLSQNEALLTELCRA